MAHFSWLHLTDLHSGMKPQHWLWPGVREIFFEDLKNLHEKCGPWDLVVFTGDLTQQGCAEEFQEVEKVLRELWSYFHKLGSSPKLLAVPGNHDLVRPNRNEPEVTLLLEWNTHPDIQQVFWDDTKSRYREVINQAFQPYTAWWEHTSFKMPYIHTGLLPGDFSATHEKEGVTLGILGLNTTFLQLTDGDYKGKLAIHTMQFHAACENDGPAWVKRHHACLLLTHHPPAWLTPDARQHLHGEIAARGRFAAHLCGHMHKNIYRETSEAGADTSRIWQGCSLFGLEYFGGHTEDLRRHGYAAGRIEFKDQKGHLRFWPREARLQGDERRIVPDHSLHLTDDQHTVPRIIELHRTCEKSTSPETPQQEPEKEQEQPREQTSPAPEYSAWSEEDWETLLYTISRKRCILMLGPDMAFEEINGQRRTLTELLARELHAELSPEVRPSVDPNNLIQVSHYYRMKAGRNDLEAKVYAFYETKRHLSSPLHEDLAALPFYLTITSTPDNMMFNALSKAGKTPHKAGYNYLEETSDMVEMGTVGAPLVFHLYGTTDEPESLVLTENNLLDFLVAVISEHPPLPQNILSQFRGNKQKSLLFLGFGFAQWYLRILLRVLQEGERKSRSFALEQNLPQDIEVLRETVLFFETSDYKITICKKDLHMFVKELRARYDQRSASS